MKPASRAALVVADPLVCAMSEARQEQTCFRCHKSPDRSHLEHRGRYHHNQR